jgi:putative DNA primase/helicase
MSSTTEQIRAALAHVDAHDRDTWWLMAMGIKSELGEAGFQVWDDWSQTASNYSAKAAKATWKSIKAAGRVTIASLFAEAIRNGWRPEQPYQAPSTEERAKLEAERAAALIEAEAIEAEQRQVAKEKAEKLWSKGHPVSAEHPYVKAKGIIPVGARQMRDMLLVPIRAGGELVNLQIIGADGSKRFLTGGQVKGASVVLGQIKGAALVLLCEGWATGCTLRAATELPVIVAFNARNMVTIAEKLAKALPSDIQVIVCGDSDTSLTGQKAASDAAARLSPRGYSVIPVFTQEQIGQYQTDHDKPPSDFNDLHHLAGIEAVSEQIHRGDCFSVCSVCSVCSENDEPNNDAALTGYGVSTPEENPEHTEHTEHTFDTQSPDSGKKQPSFFLLEDIPGQRDGVYWTPPPDEGKGPSSDIWLSSPLHILAETRDAHQSNWGRLLEWRDNDGHQHRWACPVEMLAASDTAEFRRELVRGGLTISTYGKARQKLVDYVLAHRPNSDIRLRCVSRIGWHDQRYVLPCEVYGEQAGEGVIYQGTDSGDFDQSGTLEDWQREIAASASGNTRIVFAISVAFAGVLAEMAGESGGGFHFVGTTSKGKTSTLLDPAASVWGDPDRYAKKWRTTTNGLEALCTGRNDGLLVLDELAQVAASDAGSAAYLIANGQAKSRMTKEGGNRPAQTWRVMLLSAGEIDLAQHMAEAGKTAKGGQMARLPAIPADAGAGLGTLENLHQHTSGQAFADAMKGNTRQYFGTAGAAFLAKLTQEQELTEIRKGIKDGVTELIKALAVPAGAAPEVGRVAARFALVALAGALATRYGITGWQPGEAFQAARRCFREWLAENSAGMGADDRALFAQIGGFMQTHSSTRFPPHDAGPEILARHLNRAGFSFTDDQGAMQFWVLTEPFKNELCKGFSTVPAVRVLVKAGWLLQGEVDSGKQRSTRRKRIPAMGSKQVPVYILTDAVLGGDES